MTWDAYNRRKTALRDMLALADRQGGATLDALLDTVPGAREAFDDPRIALFDAQMLFVQRVRGQVDMTVGDGLEAASVDPEDAVVDAWATTAQRMSGARLLLDAAEAEGDLTKAFAKERALLATLAGVPPRHPELQAHGRRIRDRARELVDERRAADLPEIPRNGFIDRLRSALAA